MDTPKKTRWLQRFESFDKMLSQLTQACNLDHYSDLEQAGLVKTFEFCFELSGNVLKDLLSHQGYNVKAPREAIRKGFEAGHLGEDDCETLLDALDKRDRLNHIYIQDIALEVETSIKKLYYPTLLRLHATLNEKTKQ